MILVTRSEVRSGIHLLSGVLMDSCTPRYYNSDVFRAYLISDQVREVVCEKPTYEGGHGHTHEGMMISRFSSRLSGLCEYVHEPPSWLTILSNVAENRIELVTTSEIRGIDYPAFLVPRIICSPVGTRVTVDLKIGRLGDLPELQAFATTEHYISEIQEINQPISSGMVLPVSYVSGGQQTPAALEIREQITMNIFDALIYHEAGRQAPKGGTALGRKIAKPNPCVANEMFEFDMTIALVAG